MFGHDMAQTLRQIIQPSIPVRRAVLELRRHQIARMMMERRE
jgi:hypothetical protein